MELFSSSARPSGYPNYQTLNERKFAVCFILLLWVKLIVLLKQNTDIHFIIWDQHARQLWLMLILIFLNSTLGTIGWRGSQPNVIFCKFLTFPLSTHPPSVQETPKYTSYVTNVLKLLGHNGEYEDPTEQCCHLLRYIITVTKFSWSSCGV